MYVLVYEGMTYYLDFGAFPPSADIVFPSKSSQSESSSQLSSEESTGLMGEGKEDFFLLSFTMAAVFMAWVTEDCFFFGGTEDFFLLFGSRTKVLSRVSRFCVGGNDIVGEIGL